MYAQRLEPHVKMIAFMQVDYVSYNINAYMQIATPRLSFFPGGEIPTIIVVVAVLRYTVSKVRS